MPVESIRAAQLLGDLWRIFKRPEGNVLFIGFSAVIGEEAEAISTQSGSLLIFSIV